MLANECQVGMVLDNSNFTPKMVDSQRRVISESFLWTPLVTSSFAGLDVITS